MKTATEHIARTLLEARKRKGMSQRALADLAGVPQSHISKIESGAVDLRLSSLIELSRALGLELELVPRSAVPAVQSIVRSTTPAPSPSAAAMRKIWKDIEHFGQTLDPVQAGLLSKDQLEKLLSELNPLEKLTPAQRREIEQGLSALSNQPYSKEVERLRNFFLHPKVRDEPSRPAYTLDDEGDDA